MGDDADMWQPEPGETPDVTREREACGAISLQSWFTCSAVFENLVV